MNGIHGTGNFYLPCLIIVQRRRRYSMKLKNDNTRLLKRSPFQHKVLLVWEPDYHEVLLKSSEWKFYVLKIKKREMEMNWIP